ncbi:hypothetical protein JXB11_03565, partial [Candidatus Woesearchaeota archaeon]|nr:hypothetical protein [Candidatus Woesearchaeota archaeon]
MGVAGVIAGFMQGSGIFFVGTVLTAGMLLVTQFPYLLLGDPEIKNTTIFYIITNFMTNFILFSTIGPVLIGWLA